MRLFSGETAPINQPVRTLSSPFHYRLLQYITDGHYGLMDRQVVICQDTALILCLYPLSPLTLWHIFCMTQKLFFIPVEPSHKINIWAADRLQ